MVKSENNKSYFIYIKTFFLEGGCYKNVGIFLRVNLTVKN